MASRAGNRGAVSVGGASGPPHRRCAIYTRKSTEESLGQDFNSLDAQREACEAYVASQRHEGWSLIRTAYDDGGYSGGTMVRPGLQALLVAIDAGEIDVVVVYKVDRLTRALADFARIVDRFDRHGVSFVSVTQAFNTTSSMGRLTLNVLLSFAQFEREVGAERVRDKVAASRKTGIWMGGTVPLGYRVKNRKLVIDPAEAATVRQIFALCLTLQSTPKLLAELRRLGITTAVRMERSGRAVGGLPFGTGTIGYLLHNRTYVGDVTHKGAVYPGEHVGIIDRATFDAVQADLAARAKCSRWQTTSRAILTGRIFDSNGNRMSPAHTNKRGVRYRYYVSRAIAEGRPEEVGSVRRAPAPDLERIVLEQIRLRIDGEHASKARRVPLLQADAGMPDAPPASGNIDSRQHADDPVGLALINRHLARIEVHRDRLVVTLADLPEQQQPMDQDSPAPAVAHPARTTLTVSWSPPGLRPQREVLAPPEIEATSSDGLQRQLVAAIVRARAFMAELTSGTIASVDDLARREGRHPRSIRLSLAFAFLAPDIVEKIMAGETPRHLTLTDIARELHVIDRAAPVTPPLPAVRNHDAPAELARCRSLRTGLHDDRTRLRLSQGREN